MPTQDNPADLVSRGQMSQEFLDTNICKGGPEWLSQEKTVWPQEKIHLSEIPETRNIIASPVRIKPGVVGEKTIQNCSSFKTLQLVFAYVLRYLNNTQRKLKRLSGPITAL